MPTKDAGKLLCLVLILFLFQASASAQTQGSEAPGVELPRFTVGTELVLVPVVVTTKSGEHLSGLSREEFTLQEDGRVRKVAVFEELKAQFSSVNRAKGVPGEFTNLLEGTEKPHTLIIILLDALNTPFLSQTYARDRILRYLSQKVSVEQPVSIVSFGLDGLKVVQDFTTDRAQLAASLERTRSQLAFEVGEGWLYGRDLIQRTLQAFRHLAQAYGGIPGRKSLIWVTAGLPFAISARSALASPLRYTFTQPGQQVQFQIGDTPPEISTEVLVQASDIQALSADFERAFETLNAANIAVYPVDARGLVAYFPGADVDANEQALFDKDSVAETRRIQHQAQIDDMKQFAAMTGGQAYYNRNDLDNAMAEASRDSAS